MKIRESCLQTGNFIYKPGISLTKQDFHLQRGSLGLQRGFSGYYLPVLETVKQLIEKHGTDLSTETLIHSDQGSHYTSIKFIQLLKDNELRQSMSRRANCWDNAPQESFFGHMKDELDLSECHGYEEILNAVRDWTEYYNTERYQWDLARLSPVEYYQYLTTGIYPLIIPKAKGKNNQSEASL